MDLGDGLCDLVAPITLGGAWMMDSPAIVFALLAWSHRSNARGGAAVWTGAVSGGGIVACLWTVDGRHAARR